jgi:hypothetical protein
MSNVRVNKLICDNINDFSSGSGAMSIDISNRVRRRNSPVFYGWRDTGVEAWENFGTTPVVYVYNTAQLNRGSHYNTTSGRFTCPLAGVYLIHAGYLGGNTGNYSYIWVYKNGINITSNGVHHNVGNYWKVCSQVFAIQCVVNDLLEIRIATGNSTVYGREHSHCSIWFQG